MSTEFSLQSYMAGRNNNFNLLRMLGALTIMFAHAMFITIGDDINFVTHPVKYTLGITTLNLFFVLSGMLVTASWDKHRDGLRYLLSRALRILPALMVVSLFVPFVIGPLVTTSSPGEYFSHSSPWLYWPLTSLLYPDMTLPGVFAGLPNDGVVNAPLWTLRYEAFFYGLVLIAGVLGLFQRGSFLTGFIILSFAVYLGVSFLTELRSVAAIDHLMHFGYAFLIGACFYIYRAYVPVRLSYGCVGFGAALIIVWQFGIVAGEVLLIPAAAMLGSWVAYVPGGMLRGYNLLGDYSYGVYVWHYPIEQMLRDKLGAMPALELFLLSLPIVLFMAACSWHFVERPALSSVKHVHGWLLGKLTDKPLPRNFSR